MHGVDVHRTQQGRRRATYLPQGSLVTLRVGDALVFNSTSRHAFCVVGLPGSEGASAAEEAAPSPTGRTGARAAARAEEPTPPLARKRALSVGEAGDMTATKRRRPPGAKDRAGQAQLG